MAAGADAGGEVAGWEAEGCTSSTASIDLENPWRSALGGVTGTEMPDYHDWQILLGRLDWMRDDHAIARMSWETGAVVMVGALAWGGYVVWRQGRDPIRGRPDPN